MITFSKMGGYGQLGNQLFQYAMLRAVALKKGYEVALPDRFRGTKKKDQVELSPFQLRDWRPLRFGEVRKRYKEATHAFDPAVFDQPDGTDYEGYFQTEKYFLDCENRIREEFRLQDDTNLYAEEYVANLYREEYELVIGVHVRRGDCLDNPHLFHVHTEDYFRRGMAAHGNNQRDCFLFVSDDIPWCKETFKDQENFRFCSTPSYIHDFAVLTKCDGHIISGSTFGWWGAWLASPSRKKKVICPTPWFGAAFNFDLSDMTPQGWQEIPI